LQHPSCREITPSNSLVKSSLVFVLVNGGRSDVAPINFLSPRRPYCPICLAYSPFPFRFPARRHETITTSLLGGGRACAGDKSKASCYKRKASPDNRMPWRTNGTGTKKSLKAGNHAMLPEILSNQSIKFYFASSMVQMLTRFQSGSLNMLPTP